MSSKKGVKKEININSLLEPFGLEENENLRQAFLALTQASPAPGREETTLLPGKEKLPDTSPQLIGLSGEAQSGKDLVAEYIYSKYAGVEKLAVSDSVIAEANAILKATGILISQANKSEPLIRRALQELGYGRVRENKRYWCYKVEERVGKLQAAGAKLVLITGIRTLEEREFFGKRGALIWKVERPGNKYAAEHSIESEIKAIKPDLVLYNSHEGDLGPLYRQVDEALL